MHAVMHAANPCFPAMQEGRPFLGICLGLQLLFDGSDESGGFEGLGIIPGQVSQFDKTKGLPVPHIGWNDLQQTRPSTLLGAVGDQRVYFVHSYRATPSAANKDWVLSTTQYGEPFVSSINKGQVSAVQFHPEKSGSTGLNLLNAFLEPGSEATAAAAAASARSSASASTSKASTSTGLAKRVIACLDVRSNDNGDLVVTKVRESEKG
jgi:glutamine amidotransferase/cyclase